MMTIVNYVLFVLNGLIITHQFHVGINFIVRFAFRKLLNALHVKQILQESLKSLTELFYFY